MTPEQELDILLRDFEQERKDMEKFMPRVTPILNPKTIIVGNPGGSEWIKRMFEDGEFFNNGNDGRANNAT